MNPIPLYRLSHWFHKRNIYRMARLVYRINYFLSGCGIPPGVKIGLRPIFADYGAGVILNQEVTLGDDVFILPHVVLGQNVRKGREVVAAKIVVGDRVVIGAGAKIIASGVLEIGNDAVIGANAVVTRSVPANSMALGIPAHIVPFENMKTEGVLSP